MNLEIKEALEEPLYNIQSPAETEEERVAENEAKLAGYQAFCEITDSSHSSFLNSRTPRRMWMGAMLTLRRTAKSIDSYPPQVQQFFQKYAPKVEEQLIGELRTDEKSPEKSSNAYINRAIHKVAHLFPNIEEGLDEVVNDTRSIQIEQFLPISDRIRFSQTSESSKGELPGLEVYSKRRRKWFYFPLPVSSNIMHKGGFPRVLLKIIASAPPETIEAELPPNDLDVIAKGDELAASNEAHLMGVDDDGIEMMDEFDFTKIFQTRDIDLNDCLVGRQGLIYAQRAYQAARTGKIKLEAHDRGIYGMEFFYHQKIKLANSRGIGRLMKPVLEQKALSFDFLPLNTQVDFGIYWLVMVRKFAEKTNFHHLLHRLYYLAGQIGQVREEEQSIFDTLDRVHTKYPRFDFDSPKLDEEGVTKWLHGKLISFVNKKYRDEFKVPNETDLIRFADDTLPFNVSMKGYRRSNQPKEYFIHEWQEYLERCRQRTAEALKTE
jgi:hypothetical protein